jgi:two-component system, sensor histidine kinase and response regulator
MTPGASRPIAGDGEFGAEQFFSDSFREPLVVLIPAPRDNLNGSMPSLDVIVVGGDASRQRLLESSLAAARHRPRIASNGLHAIRLFLQQAPDVVLVDLDSPTDDNVPTSLLLRGLQSDKRQVPIIAITTPADELARSRALASGVDAFLAQPLAIDTMHRLLSELQARPTPLVTAPLGGAHANPRSTAERLPAVDMTAALGRLGGDAELLGDLIGFFLEDAFPLLVGMHEAIEKEDWENARRRAHSLKGLAANFSALAAVHALQTIETCGQGSESTMVTTAREVDGEIARVAAALVDYREGCSEVA